MSLQFSQIFAVVISHCSPLILSRLSLSFVYFADLVYLFRDPVLHFIDYLYCFFSFVSIFINFWHFFLLAWGSVKGRWGVGWCREKEGERPIWWYHLCYILEKAGRELGGIMQKMGRGFLGSGRSQDRS